MRKGIDALEDTGTDPAPPICGVKKRAETLEKTMSAEQAVFGDDGRLGIRDVRLAERALREQWPISDALRGRLVARLGEVLDDPAASPREVIAAVFAGTGSLSFSSTIGRTSWMFVLLSRLRPGHRS